MKEFNHLKSILFLAVSLVFILCSSSFSKSVAQGKNFSITIAYTANTWGQIEPCPS